tara:strand:+ start:4650 stop:4787 length:138 start_codon:yes stop_codon:yes gene_type:complete
MNNKNDWLKVLAQKEKVQKELYKMLKGDNIPFYELQSDGTFKEIK